MKRLTTRTANLKTSAVNQMGYAYIQVDDIDEAMEKLSRYEDTGLEPGEILTAVQMAEIACMQIRYKKMQELLERAAECIENCYGRETELSEAIRKELN